MGQRDVIASTSRPPGWNRVKRSRPDRSRLSGQ